mgnify:CR=1 FL=1
MTLYVNDKLLNYYLILFHMLRFLDKGEYDRVIEKVRRGEVLSKDEVDTLIKFLPITELHFLEEYLMKLSYEDFIRITCIDSLYHFLRSAYPSNALQSNMNALT